MGNKCCAPDENIASSPRRGSIAYLVDGKKRESHTQKALKTRKAKLDKLRGMPETEQEQSFSIENVAISELAIKNENNLRLLFQLNLKRKSGREFTQEETQQFQEILSSITRINNQMANQKYEGTSQYDTIKNTWLSDNVEKDHFNSARMSNIQDTSIVQESEEASVTIKMIEQAQLPDQQNNQEFDVIKAIFNDSDLNQTMVLVSKNSLDFKHKKSNKSIPEKYLEPDTKSEKSLEKEKIKIPMKSSIKKSNKDSQKSFKLHLESKILKQKQVTPLQKAVTQAKPLKFVNTPQTKNQQLTPFKLSKSFIEPCKPLISRNSSNSGNKVPPIDLSKVDPNIQESNDDLIQYQILNQRFSSNNANSIQEQFQQELDYYSVTSSDLEEEKDHRRANSCQQTRDHSFTKIPSALQECAICKKMISKAIFEKHEKMCQENRKKHAYYKYQQELITGKMNRVLNQSHSKAGKEIYIKKMKTQLESLEGSLLDDKSSKEKVKNPNLRVRSSVQRTSKLTNTADSEENTSQKSLTFKDFLQKKNTPQITKKNWNFQSAIHKRNNIKVKAQELIKPQEEEEHSCEPLTSERENLEKVQCPSCQKYFQGDREWITQQHMAKCKEMALQDKINARKMLLQAGQHKRIRSFMEPKNQMM